MGGSCVSEFYIFLVIVICAKARGTSWAQSKSRQGVGFINSLAIVL